MRRAYACYFGALVLFGTNCVVAAGISLPGWQIAMVRTLLSSLLLGGIAVIAVRRAKRALRSDVVAMRGGNTVDAPRAAKRGLGARPARRRRNSQLLAPRDAALLALSGVFMGVSWMAQYQAYQLVGVAVTSLVYCLGLVLVVASGPLLLGERASVPRIAGLVVVLAGVVVMNWQAASAGANGAGLACALFTALAYAAMVLASKRVRNTRGVQGPAVQQAAAFASTVAFAALLAVAPVAGGDASLAPQAPQLADFPAIALLGLVNTGFGCYLYFTSIPHLSAQMVGVCDYLEPLIGMVLAAVLLGETLAPGQFAGGLLILAGIAAGELGARRAARRRE